MNVAELLREGYGRLPSLVDAALDGLSDDELATRLDAEANTVGWLVWHLARVQDDHVAAAFGSPQLYPDGWSQRFSLPFDDAEIGYGHEPDDVAAVRAPADLLSGYAHAVVDRSLELLAGVSAEDLDRVVDEHFDPPVTLGVRLVSVLDDDLQHAGQAAFLRGLLVRRRS